ncbi:hypothetical protein K2173_002957 [Erythroxylum novogranatense]|uniref:WIYLD domain-containing protein n=1 Tax=Erythroxylum novogranatense TaxID=1862640 RepID=A0AAV8TR87_9ROSI|nr:hypothetical protein K2173_002957 [Erythroxylum novogranatense]
MAPKRRPRKFPTGERRIDAALDAMHCYGFPEKLVISTINELLDVYGQGGVGWPFIEEGCYRILLDAIIEKLENEPEEKANESQDRPLLTSEPDFEALQPPTRQPDEAVVYNWNGVNWDQDSRKKQGSEDGETNGVEKPRSNKPSDGILPINQEAGVSSQRRNRCYGWISSDDDEADLVELEPAPLPENLARLLQFTRTRKKRWDVTPENE